MNPRSTPEHSRSTGTPEDAQKRNMDKVADPQTDRAGRGTGLPAREPQLDREPTDSPLTPKEASIKSSIRLPHERDEDVAMTGSDGGGAPSPQVRQAAEDLAAGRKDTSRANETDQAYHRLHESEAGGSSPSPAGRGGKKPGA